MKQLTWYQAIIVDMDGTLYYQKPVRLAMLGKMMTYFWRLSDFLIIWKYRKLYERGLSEEERMARLPNRAPQAIQEWMIHRALPFVHKYRDAELIDLLEKVASKNVSVIVYSDYPVKEKLEAIHLSPEQCYSAADLGTMKPEASRLINILLAQGINPKNCLVIGDRYEKDGKLAENMNADCLILPKGKKIRRRLYLEIADI